LKLFLLPKSAKRDGAYARDVVEIELGLPYPGQAESRGQAPSGFTIGRLFIDLPSNVLLTSRSSIPISDSNL
jgi:hypothetical protein